MHQKSQLYYELRQTYPEFHYHAYHISEDEANIYLRYDFSIPGLAEFHPHLEIAKKKLPLKSIDDPIVENLAFNIGLVELISYWKVCCPPKVIIECGELNEDQISWWKKLYFYGLGELFYTNGIDSSRSDFMEIICTGKSHSFNYPASQAPAEGYLVLIGGGKDSIVTLETLDTDPARDYCMIVNPKPVTRRCAELAGFSDGHVIEVRRTIDQTLLNLNQQNFINGHTPFSTMLAFVSYLVAYLAGIAEVVVSNESSANESNLPCSKVNHQYSKSFEFEQDFNYYATEYLKAPVRYFSFLRPLNELQIAKIFSRLEKYHPVFRSCNVGSKGREWVWCGHCAKCLFAFIILAPYLYPDRLIKIFGKNLLDDPTLEATFLELIGRSNNKPFDCVGTFDEVNFAVTRTIEQLQSASHRLPYLLKLYLDRYGLADTSDDLERQYNNDNNLTPAQNKLLKAEVFHD